MACTNSANGLPSLPYALDNLPVKPVFILLRSFKPSDLIRSIVALIDFAGSPSNISTTQSIEAWSILEGASLELTAS